MEKTNQSHSHSGHRSRLRNLILNTDVASLPEHQILELVLTYVLPQKDVNPLAHKLLEEFGTLANVFDSKPEELVKVEGVGEVVASFLNFCSILPEIYKNSRAKTKITLPGAKEIIEYILNTVTFTAIEKFYYLCLNEKGDLLCFKTLGSGSSSQLYVNKREFINQILKYPTQSVVICHTHPNGKPQPSDNDIAFTNDLYEILMSLSIKLCDHIIVSPEGYYSFFHHHLLGYNTNDNPFGKLKSTLLGTNDFVYAQSDGDFPNFNDLIKK